MMLALEAGMEALALETGMEALLVMLALEVGKLRVTRHLVKSL